MYVCLTVDDVKEAEVEAQNSISLLVWMQKKRRQCNFVWARWREREREERAEMGDVRSA